MTTIMLAPNGGRRMPSDHPAIPITIAQAAACAAEAQTEGADAIHVHLRDADGAHLLDAGTYRELTAEIARRAPGLPVQITTEAVGRYAPDQQMDLIRALRPAFASCALRELARDDEAKATDFYREAAEAGTGIQHILYAPDEVPRLLRLVPHDKPLSVLFVIGAYPDGGTTPPGELAAFLSALHGTAPSVSRGVVAEWMACAFGRHESRVLAAAMALGGHARVGFENSMCMADGSIAPDNIARVREVVALRRSLGLVPGPIGPVLGTTW